MESIERVLYTTVWDGGIEVTTAAEWNSITKEVFNIESVNISVEVLEEEFIELSDGNRLEVEENQGRYFTV